MRAVSAPRLIKEVKPRYTPEALRQRNHGSVVLEATVTSDGCLSQIRVVRSLDRGGLDEEAVTAVAQWTIRTRCGCAGRCARYDHARLLDSLRLSARRGPERLPATLPYAKLWFRLHGLDAVGALTSFLLETTTAASSCHRTSALRASSNNNIPSANGTTRTHTLEAIGAVPTSALPGRV